MPDREIPLLGGTANRGKVVRVGDTVRRPQRPTSPATHALLVHLADIGFDGAPRFLGVDAQDREVLTYIPGTAVTPPYPDWALTDDALVSVADLLREYHQAAERFDPAGYGWPASPPPSFVDGLISHNDPNLDNVVFRDGRAVALIDFDLASPGSRVWDVACAARLWAPVRPGRYIDDVRRDRSLERFRLFVDRCGLRGAGDRSRRRRRRPAQPPVVLRHRPDRRGRGPRGLRRVLGRREHGAGRHDLPVVPRQRGVAAGRARLTPAP